MKLVCGLGNPGLKYKNTRHNIGFLVVDNFAKVNKFKINKKELILLKPKTYMNNSGDAVKAAVDRLKIGLKDILIVCDDVNLKLGIIRLRASGRSGGHKGLKSIIERLHSENFNRLRIGIGLERNGMLKDYVLSGFKSAERPLLKKIINTATDAITVWAEEGIEAAMNKFNTKNVDGGESRTF